ncbi:transcription initiation factor TFIID 23-30kDa subunit-domain-containing protein [Protomyces lactucae-debilis]|uniref:Transcription initiation factor TFIID 23-30kDa subunit-domain-containing protein n=1 Tax=Protomyces lactucae-debilis TaxID=2754530 RepID=A0A1Y2F8F3_PROLT|nr:transcription initiation factor TFIID 23-30kDa subunit-domain-containing protein [Protomyces lactucae-debilis]ORY79917.1 transcription initiation factor TFIID 23-30kDa subunit-domain-containing protein [Protomyces lactucae-debilis]
MPETVEEDADEDEPLPQAPRTTAPDRTLKDFLKILDTHAPIIPDAVTDYYLSQAGFECDDPRVKRLLALAAQKFVSDIAQDAYQHSKIRSSGTTGDRGRAVLTMDDLGAAVQEYGINIKRQDFMR